MIASLATWQNGREKPWLKLKRPPTHPPTPQKFIYLFIYKLKTPKNLQKNKNKKANKTQILRGGKNRNVSQKCYFLKIKKKQSIKSK